MTPKEKAKELFKKYYCMSNHSKSKVKIIEFETAKKCAIIAIDEILKTFDNEWTKLDFWTGELNGTIDFWKLVRQEVEHF